MMDTVWKKISAQRPKGKRLFVFIGVFSGLIWAFALVAVFALKDKGITKALAKAAGAKSDTLDIHGLKTDAVESDHGEHSEQVAHGDHGDHGEQVAPGDQGHHDDQGHHGDHGEPVDHGNQEHDSHEALGHADTAPQDSHEKVKQESEATLTVDMPTRAEWEALKELAELRAKAGELDQAVRPLKRILVMPTRDADLLTLATRVFLGTGNYREALQTAEQAIVLRPHDLNLKAQAIEATYRLGKVEQAYTTGQAEVKAHPTDLSLLMQLATMEVEIGPTQPDYGKSLEAVLKIDPNHEPALYLLGRKSQLEGNYKDAEIAFRAVLKLNPQNSKAHGQLGISLHNQKKLAEAQIEYEADLALAPADYNTWFNLGELHMAKATLEFDPEKIRPQRERAMHCFLKALEFNANHAQAAFRVGVLLNGNGQYKEAINYLETSLKLDAKYVPTLVQLALSYEYLKLPVRAKHYLTLAYELDPLNKVVLFKLKQLS